MSRPSQATSRLVGRLALQGRGRTGERVDGPRTAQLVRGSPRPWRANGNQWVGSTPVVQGQARAGASDVPAHRPPARWKLPRRGVLKGR